MAHDVAHTTGSGAAVSPGRTTRPLHTVKRRLAFMTDMGLRGTSVAEFDYADYAERLLRGLQRPLVLYDSAQVKPVPAVLQKFVQRFGRDNVLDITTTTPNRDGGLARTTTLLRRHNVTDYYELRAACAPRAMIGAPSQEQMNE